MKKEIVFATNNAHKLDEIGSFIQQHGLRVTIRGLKEVGIEEEIPENENTFTGNAWAKVNYIQQHYSINNVFADDSGLEIQALNNEPGVLSARYAGAHGNHQANIGLVLERMKNALNRDARFVTAIAGYWNGNPVEVIGEVEGKITRQPQGWGGFGYDPIFIPAGNSRSFAEMSTEEKNLLSHRARAVEKWAESLFLFP